MTDFVTNASGLIIFTNDGLHKCLKKYRVGTIKELEEKLWFDYGKTLTDRRNAEN